MRNEKAEKVDQKQIEKAKEAARIREEQIVKAYIESMRNKREKEKQTK